MDGDQRFEFRAHLAVNAANEQEAREKIDRYLDHARVTGDSTSIRRNFTAELDEGSADIIEEG